ncbi:MAG: lateral flagellar basal body P-ring FlgIL [Aeromonadaceae bacterium]
MKKFCWLWLALLAVTATPGEAAQRRALLDIADVQGLRDNQLVGYGLVVGLSGTGDRSQVKFTGQSMANMLKQFGVQLPDDIDPKLKNVAAVSVQATIPALAGKGQTLDVTVTSIGDAKSLRGGSLLLTPLRGIDGEVYAVAQGNLVVGGVKAEGQSGSSVTINVPTAGIIPNGAIVEREIASATSNQDEVILNIKQPNFRTARNVERAINRQLGTVAKAVSAGRVTLRAPKDPSQRIAFMALLEDIDVDLGRERPKVVFNSRTGTVVLGQDVKVRKAAVSHGNLTVTITESKSVSQPNAFAGGQTTVTPNSSVNVQRERNNMFVWPEGTSLEVIVRAINSLGATPDDIMAILQALNEADALEGELVVI